LSFPADGNAQSTEVHGIIHNALRLQRLTSDLLDVARIESNSFSLNRERFNLGEVISCTIRDFRDQQAAEAPASHTSAATFRCTPTSTGSPRWFSTC